FEQGQLFEVGTGKGCPAVGYRVARLRRQDESLVRVAIDDDLSQQEDRLLRAVCRHDLRGRIELDAEASPTPAGDCRAQLGKTFGEGISQPLLERVDERPSDRGIG